MTGYSGNELRIAATPSRLKELAVSVASICLSEAPLVGDCVDLRRLAKKWSVSLHFDEPGTATARWSRSGLLAYIEADDAQLCLEEVFPREDHRATFALDPYDIPARFAIAHELAHVVLKSRDFVPAERQLTAREREQLCDLAAEHIVLPEKLLIQSIDVAALCFSLEMLEELRARLRAPLSLILRKLAVLVSRGEVRVVNGCLIATLAAARKSGTNFAPRVLRRCVPAEWYLPLNKRLSTLGLALLEDIFYDAPLYSSQTVRCRFKLWNMEQQRSSALDSSFSVRCYRYKDRQSGSMPRLLLAVFDTNATVDK